MDENNGCLGLRLNFLRETAPGAVEGHVGLALHADPAELVPALLGLDRRSWLSALSGGYAAHVARAIGSDAGRVARAAATWRDTRPSGTMRRLAGYAARHFTLERVRAAAASAAACEPWLAARLAAAGGAPAVAAAIDLARAVAREAPCAAALRRLVPGQDSPIELSLPFVPEHQWPAWWRTLAGARLEATELGRIVLRGPPVGGAVGHLMLALQGALARGRGALDALTLAYTAHCTLARAQLEPSLEPLVRAYRLDSRMLGCARAAAGTRVEVEITLAAPGGLASAWLRAPHERDRNAVRVYSAVSRAVQSALRLWVPFLYFAGLDRYANIPTAWPLIAYQCTAPFSDDGSGWLTYDIHSPGQMLLARQTTLRGLADQFDCAAGMLAAAGRRGTARTYANIGCEKAWRVIDSSPTHLNALFRAEQILVGALVDLGVQTRMAADQSAADPGRAVRTLTGFAAEFGYRFQDGLRRIYGGRDFSGLAPLLILEATRALAAAPPLSAVVRLRGDGGEHVFVTTPD